MNSDIEKHEQMFKQLSRLLESKLDKAKEIEIEAYYLQIELINYEKIIAKAKAGKLDAITFESRFADELGEGAK